MPSENKEKLIRDARIGIVVFISLLACVFIMLFYFVFNGTTINMPEVAIYICIGLVAASALFLFYILWIALKIRQINKGEEPNEQPKQEQPKEEEGTETSGETDNK